MTKLKVIIKIVFKKPNNALARSAEKPLNVG